jgi:photosystem II stability/assembly factor-like uncharacterized protein
MKKIFLLSLLIYVCFFPQLLHSQQWQYVGLEGRRITILASDPADESILYAGCLTQENEGGLYRSTDGGATWNSLLKECVWDIDFHPQNPDIMYVCSDRVLKSMDKGETWFYADSGTVDAERANGMFGPLVINPNLPDMLLVSQTYGLTLRTLVTYKSEDGGKSWKSLEYPLVPMAVDPFCENTVYASGSTGYVYKSTDFGETWEQWQYVGPDAGSATDIKIISIDSVVFHIIARGATGFYITQDGGATWEQKNDGLPKGSIINHVCVVDSTFYISSFKFPSSNKIESGVFKSRLSDIHWELVGISEDFQGAIVGPLLYSTHFYKLFAGTGNGIICYDLSVSVETFSKKSPHSFSLKQNYPNPFNNNTVIEYELKKTAHVILDIYDINGTWIKSLVNDRKGPGIYKVMFSSQRLGSGVYFCQLKTDSFSETRKLLLIK